MIVTTEELKELIASKANFILLDVRNKDELHNGIIPTSKNLPLPEFEGALDLSEEEFKEKFNFSKPTKDDNIICYCRTGQRSHIATQLAISKGFKAKNYEGSIWQWSEIDPNVKKYGN
jgi:thiosulfate:glutathione sulfurtransferase